MKNLGTNYTNLLGSFSVKKSKLRIKLAVLSFIYPVYRKASLGGIFDALLAGITAAKIERITVTAIKIANIPHGIMN